MSRAVLGPVLLTIICGAACSDPPPAPKDLPPVEYTSPPDGDDALVPTPGFPGLSQKLGSAYRTSVLGVLAAADGSVWVAHADEADASLKDRALVIERIDPQLRTSSVVAQATVRQADLKPSRLDHVALCGHPSGEVTLATFISTGGNTPSESQNSALALTRFAGDGSVVHTAYIDDPGAPIIDGHAAYLFGNDLACAGVGEDLFLLTTTQDLRLYRVAPDLSVRWSSQVMPRTNKLIFEKAVTAIRARIAVGDDGIAVTAITLWAEDRALVASTSGAALPATNGDADVLVTRFGADGTRLSTGLLGGPGVELVQGLRVDGDRISVLAEVTLTKHEDRPNNTLERDVVLVAGDPALNRTEQAVAINLCNDDYVLDAIPSSRDGGFVVTGGACGIQADTGSLISNRAGYVVTIGPDGRREGVTWFTSDDRDTQVQALTASLAGELVVAGIRNGPITHTDASELFNEGWVGVVSPPAAR
jgi:hypothetical protein